MTIKNLFPHFVLFFDINKTIVLHDSAKNASPKDMLNSLLAETVHDFWDNTTEKMTFKKYVETVLAPGNDYDKLTKEARFNYQRNFIIYLKETGNKNLEFVQSEFNKAEQRLSCQESVVFDSFFSLITCLNQQQIPYSIILRTFGIDLSETTQAIIDYSNISFTDTGFFKEHQLILNNQKSMPLTSYEFLQKVMPGHHYAIRDDFLYWNSNQQRQNFGKPFPCDIHNAKIPIFFDDNAFEKDIIAIHSKNREITKHDLLKSGQLVAVDTLSAIQNKNYFIEKIEKLITASISN
jgi:hypothetical protein